MPAEGRLLRDVPLFPLGTLLFPEGHLPLRIFEPRYMDMAKVCIKDDLPFGVCMIASGRETGAPAIPHGTGTLARIHDWDMQQLGVLLVQCRGGERFRIVSRHSEASGLQRADVELIATSSPSLDSRHSFLAELLARVIENIEDPSPLQPCRFDDAEWVACRLGEMLPMPLPMKQRILELGDAGEQLDVIHQFLRDKGLLNTSG